MAWGEATMRRADRKRTAQTSTDRGWARNGPRNFAQSPLVLQEERDRVLNLMLEVPAAVTASVLLLSAIGVSMGVMAAASALHQQTVRIVLYNKNNKFLSILHLYGSTLVTDKEGSEQTGEQTSYAGCGFILFYLILDNYP